MATPPIQVHSTPAPDSMVIADVKFNSTPSTDLTIYHFPQLGTNHSSASHVKLSNHGAMTTGHHSFTVPKGTILSDTVSDGEEVTFEWRHSGEGTIKTLAKENLQGEDYAQNDRGLKLVRAGGNEILAVFVGGSLMNRRLNPRRIAGKLRFVGDSEVENGKSEFRLLVVLSLLSMMERGYDNERTFSGCNLLTF